MDIVVKCTFDFVILMLNMIQVKYSLKQITIYIPFLIRIMNIFLFLFFRKTTTNECIGGVFTRLSVKQ